MASPTTHFVVTWLLWRFLTWVVGFSFTALETFSIFFWGTLIDLDHFIYPEFVKELFKVRIPRLLHGGGGEPVSKKIHVSWLHIWPGSILSIITGVVVFAPKHRGCVFLPFAFYLIHYIGIDRWQISAPGMEPYTSWFYPFHKEGHIRKSGYPIKSHVEMLVSSVMTLIIFIYDGPSVVVWIVRTVKGFFRALTG